MANYKFTLIFDDRDKLSNKLEAKVSQACPTAKFIISAKDGQVKGDFEREAPSLAEAVSTTLDELRGAHVVATAEPVEGEQVVTSVTAQEDDQSRRNAVAEPVGTPAS